MVPISTDVRALWGCTYMYGAQQEYIWYLLIPGVRLRESFKYTGNRPRCRRRPQRSFRPGKRGRSQNTPEKQTASTRHMRPHVFVVLSYTWYSLVQDTGPTYLCAASCNVCWCVATGDAS